MLKLFNDIDEFRLNNDGRDLSRRLEDQFAELFRKYDTAELTYIIQESASIAAGLARLRRQEDRRDAMNNARDAQRNAVVANVRDFAFNPPAPAAQWFYAPPIEQQAIPFDWADVGRAGAAPIPPEPEADDVEFDG